MRISLAVLDLAVQRLRIHRDGLRGMPHGDLFELKSLDVHPVFEENLAFVEELDVAAAERPGAVVAAGALAAAAVVEPLGAVAVAVVELADGTAVVEGPGAVPVVGLADGTAVVERLVAEPAEAPLDAVVVAAQLGAIPFVEALAAVAEFAGQLVAAGVVAVGPLVAVAVPEPLAAAAVAVAVAVAVEDRPDAAAVEELADCAPA